MYKLRFPIKFMSGPAIFQSNAPAESINLKRSFHPVGQGAFYSEVFSVEGGDDFTVVYDCGTESDEALINNEIDAFVNGLRSKTVDILFISHFHKDHISGLQRLASKVTIKKTIIPLLPEEIILVSRVHNYLKCVARNKKDRRKEIEPVDKVIEDLYLEGETSKRFGDIIAVRPYERDVDTNGWFPTSSKGKVMTGEEVTGLTEIWKYIPFNSVLVDYDRAKQFKTEVESIKLFDDSGKLNKDQLLFGLRAKVKELYKEVLGKECADDNLYTLVVESLPAEGYKEESLARASRCLFTGDLDSVGNGSLWSRFDSTFKINDIGIIQVPHHGAKENWRKEFITPVSKIFVVSVGSNNTYHHPDFWAMEDIRKKDRLFIVKEDPTTKKSFDFVVMA